MNLAGSTILVTGGTGSFGQAFIWGLLNLAKSPPAKVIVFSRDEFKQLEMRERMGNDERLRFFLGDVRNKERLEEALQDVEIVIHAAALKQVPAAEYNPTEAVDTNVKGTQNVVSAALYAGVGQVLMLSTDKAVAPANLYGATKLTAERTIIAGNARAGRRRTCFSVVRYGNVAGSRGSVVPIFRKIAKEGGAIPITHEEMTRFWITLPQAARFVHLALANMVGGEIFVPRLRSARVIDIAKAICPGRTVKTIGIRPGEKLHETLISAEEGGRTLDFGEGFVIVPDFDWRSSGAQLSLGQAVYQNEAKLELKMLPQGFSYHSNAGLEPHLTIEEIEALLAKVPE